MSRKREHIVTKKGDIICTISRTSAGNQEKKKKKKKKEKRENLKDECVFTDYTPYDFILKKKKKLPLPQGPPFFPINTSDAVLKTLFIEAKQRH